LEGNHGFGEAGHGMVGAGKAGEAVSEGVFQAVRRGTGEQYGKVAGGQGGRQGYIQALDSVIGRELVVDAFEGSGEPFRLDDGRDGHAGEVGEFGGEAGEEGGG